MLNVQNHPEKSPAALAPSIPYKPVRWSLVVKWALDIVGSFILFILFAPLFVLIAIAIKLDSSGPVFFRRPVVGRGGEPFVALKFRSMMTNAHEVLLQDPALLEQYRKTLKLDNDSRITRVGRLFRKTSLDELPQLINVLRGEMSLVGPRVLGDIELARYGEHQEKVLSVKPGMAGLWVASGRHALSFERRVELDMEYIDNWSLWLDIKIFFKSLLTVITMIGAA